MKVYHYPKCTTCKRALKWIDEKGVEVEKKHIVEETPSKEELREIYKKSGLELKKFFNTSGIKYKEMGLKDKLKDMSEEEQLDLLASNGMLIKRPILIGDDFVLVGAKEEEWMKKLGKQCKKIKNKKVLIKIKEIKWEVAKWQKLYLP